MGKESDQSNRRSNPLSKPPGLLPMVGPVLTRRGKNELVKFISVSVLTQWWFLGGRNLDIHDNDTLAERSKAVAQGAIPKGRGFEPHRRHFCLLHQRNLTSRMGDRWGITERSHCLRGLMTSVQGARCPGFNAQRKPLFLTLSCLILFLGADHSEPPCPRSDKRWVVAICLA